MEHLFSMQPYEATTERITISVRPIYLDGQSDVIGKSPYNCSGGTGSSAML